MQGGRYSISRNRVKEVLKVYLKEKRILQMAVKCHDVAPTAVMKEARWEFNIAIAKIDYLIAATVRIALRRK